MNPLIVMLICLTLLYSCSAETRNNMESREIVTPEIKPNEPWINFEYDSAVVYLYNVDTTLYKYAGTIVQGDSLNKSIEKEYSSTLSSSEITTIGKIMSTTPAKESFSDCFEPHHGIVFYNKGKITGHISICFLCDNMHANPQTLVTEPSPKMLHQLFLDHGIPVFESLEEYLHFNETENEL